MTFISWRRSGNYVLPSECGNSALASIRLLSTIHVNRNLRLCVVTIWFTGATACCVRILEVSSTATMFVYTSRISCSCHYVRCLLKMLFSGCCAMCEITVARWRLTPSFNIYGARVYSSELLCHL